MSALIITGTDPDTEWAFTVLDTLACAELHRYKGKPETGVPGTPPNCCTLHRRCRRWTTTVSSSRFGEVTREQCWITTHEGESER